MNHEYVKYCFLMTSIFNDKLLIISIQNNLNVARRGPGGSQQCGLLLHVHEECYKQVFVSLY